MLQGTRRVVATGKISFLIAKREIQAIDYKDK
jgi:hypothetical protein